MSIKNILQALLVLAIGYGIYYSVSTFSQTKQEGTNVIDSAFDDESMREEFLPNGGTSPQEHQEDAS